MHLRRVAAPALVALVVATSCGTEVRRSVDLHRSEAGGFSNERVLDVNKVKTMRHVWRLANRIGVRVRATEGEHRATNYTARQFRSYGYRVRIQEFDTEDGVSHNVYAWWPESINYPVIVGAHMDTVRTSPGANDDASGVASMLEVARLIAGKQPARFVRFVAFGSEEYTSNGVHHVGSTTFVRRLGKEGRRKLAGMVSVDMVADGRPLLVGNSGIAGDVVARYLYRKLDDRFAVRWHQLCDCSDNGPFEHAGIPASFMWSGDEPNYHDSTDTVRNLKPDDLVRSARALRYFVLSLNYDVIHRFRRG